MEHRVQRLYENGRRLQKHVRQAGETRGTIHVKVEHIDASQRAILVARVTPAAGCRLILPLYEVTLLGTSGESWVFAGHERVEAGAVRELTLVGQRWLVEPVLVQDLVELGAKWNAAARDAEDLREEVGRLRDELSRVRASP